MKSYIFLIFLFIVPSLSLAQTPFDEIQRSYIEGNVPPPEVFNKLLKRDLLIFFKKDKGNAVKEVKFKLLRDGPTQSGVSYPKYYLWAVVKNETKIITKGAVRVAAIEKTHFEVTHFVSVDEIQKNPDRLHLIFPRVLVPSILSAAGAK